MKTIALILLAFVVGCDSKNTQQVAHTVNSVLTVVDVDGHKYLCSSKGGIVHLESCPCKKK